MIQQSKVNPLKLLLLFPNPPCGLEIQDYLYPGYVAFYWPSPWKSWFPTLPAALRYTQIHWNQTIPVVSYQTKTRQVHPTTSINQAQMPLSAMR